MNCKFKTGAYSGLECSGEVVSLETLSEDETDKLLSEIGMISGVATRKFDVCTCHKLEILAQNKSRTLKRKRCAMPAELVAHKHDPPRRDRILSKSLVMKIHGVTGLVLPIGTPICKTCRQQYLFKEKVHENTSPVKKRVKVAEDTGSEEMTDITEGHVEHELCQFQDANAENDGDPTLMNTSPMRKRVKVAEDTGSDEMTDIIEGHVEHEFQDANAENDGDSTLMNTSPMRKRVKVAEDTGSDEMTDIIEGHIEHEFQDANAENDGDSTLMESQDFSIGSYTGSQESEASVCVIGKREQLNSFLRTSDVSPVKEKKIPLRLSSEKCGKLCVQKALQCLHAVCEVICPGEGEALRRLVYQSINDQNANEIKDLEVDRTLIILKDIYCSAESWTLQRQILSIIVTDRSFNEVKQIIPDVTAWKYGQAKAHSSDVGCGVTVVQAKTTRNKVDRDKLEHFIDFIISSNVVKDLPYGSKCMKLSTGEMVEVPNLIRSLVPSSLISQYLQFCEAEQTSHLASSTLFNILNDCAASVRRCVEGLDYYVAEGSKAFQTLEAAIDKLDLPDVDRKESKQQLLDAKRYIKTDFKVHIEKSSRIADHCRNFALSGQDRCFAEICDDEHDEVCRNCRGMEDILDRISKKVNETSWENKDAVLFEVESATDCIREWKAHTMRARNQEDAKLNLIQSLMEGQLIMTCDWAMKFLPRKYREGQTDWFGKRGLNWHIAVTVLKTNGNLSTFTHVHVFSSQVSQDATVTSAIISDVAADLRKLVPNLRELHIFSDNAGCYKNTYIMLNLRTKLGNLMKTYNFSEAQDGKGPCDRRASHIKSAIKRYVNEGNDVTCAEEMKKAIDAQPANKVKVKVVDTVTLLDYDRTKMKPIAGISQFHNFQFEDEGLRVWKAFGIGSGKFLSWASLRSLPEGNELLVKQDWCDSNSALIHEENAEARSSKDRVSFDCPKEGCAKSFCSQSALDGHIIIGNCDYNRNMTIHDQAKVMYGSKVNSCFTPKHSVIVPCDAQQGTAQLDQGWALKTKKKRELFFLRSKQTFSQRSSI